MITQNETIAESHRTREMQAAECNFDPSKTVPGAAFSNIQTGRANGGNVELSFSILCGDPGASGQTSTDVTNAITNERINNAQNPTSVQTLSLTLSDPPTKAEVQAVLDQVNDLITALQRQP